MNRNQVVFHTQRASRPMVSLLWLSARLPIYTNYSLVCFIYGQVMKALLEVVVWFQSLYDPFRYPVTNQNNCLSNLLSYPGQDPAAQDADLIQTWVFFTSEHFSSPVGQLSYTLVMNCTGKSQGVRFSKVPNDLGAQSKCESQQEFWKEPKWVRCLHVSYSVWAWGA